MNKQKLQRLAIAAVLSALSLVLMMTVRFPLFTPFYEMEFSDLPILVCSGILGPLYSIVCLLVVCVIQTLTVSSSSGIIGFLMHFLSSGLMILIMCFITKRVDGIKGKIVGSVVGVLVVVIVMIPMNIWLTSSFMQLPLTDFVKGYLGVCVAFNLVKAGSNVILYNIISPLLQKQIQKFIK